MSHGIVKKCHILKNMADFLFLFFFNVVSGKTGLIFATSIFALPLALAIFPQRQTVRASRLEERFWDVTSDGERGSGRERLVEFNRGI